MQPKPSSPEAPVRSYGERAAFEQKMFGKRENADTASGMGRFYVRNYRWPRLQQVTGCETHIDFYVKYFAERLSRTPGAVLLSIGSGEANLELLVAKRLKAQGLEFSFECMDFAAERNERAMARAEKAGLQDQFRFLTCDFNTWKPERRYAGIMAHYALHHVVNLEGLFAAIEAGLAPGGVFLTIDMIGRNGHQRWPESLEVVEKIWATLPEEKRRNHAHKKVFDRFPNLDLSSKGFEGIRAQDILPLLVKQFRFEAFVAFGGFIDVFTGPGWGPNFDPENPQDLAYIELLHYLNDLLIELGHIKPTQMFAAMSLDPGATPAIYRNWTPEFCIRRP